MELQLILVLLIAFLLLGPEGMLKVASALGELTRKARELVDQLKMEAYAEELNKKILQEEEEFKEGLPSDIAQQLKEELEGDKDEQGKTARDASDGASEGAKV
ncbi:MAG: preprotein translocase subunit TatA [Aquificae bacterium]|nr:preprotein translocase subunit TatA [Aquificota bacterium]